MSKIKNVELKSLKKYIENKYSPEEARQVLLWIEKSDASLDLEGDFKNAWQKIKVNSGDYSKWSEKLEKIHERIEMEEIYNSLDLNKKNSKVGFNPKDRPSKTGYELQNYTKKSSVRYVVSGLIASIILIVMVVAFFQFPQDVEQIPTIVQIEKSTEPGQKLSFHLEDGTKVILNAGSKIWYSSNFNIHEREVILEGEAFFEVSKDASRPFRVVTESVVTTALGTSFNINAFPSNENIEIALVTGKVSVEGTIQSGNSKSLLLNSGEMATVLKSEQNFTKSSFDFNEQISWKDGLIYFKDATYYDIVSHLENWYGVSIKTDKIPLQEWKFSGKFDDETLENILVALQFGHNFDFEINGKEVKLNF